MPNRAAFLASIAIFLVGAIPLAGRLAAHGGGINHSPFFDPPPVEASAPTFLDNTGNSAELQPKDVTPGGQAVCVRLCDGFFFPSATRSGGDEACSAQCPDTPTVRYTEPAGSDKIEDAVSLKGAPYTALPTSSRYRTTLDATCTCHRSMARAYSYSVLNDPTLRKGDVVVTPKGFMVFQGAKGKSIAMSDFVALSQARSLPQEQRAAIAALEGRRPSQPAGAGAVVGQNEVSGPAATVAATQ
ncbi:MAG: DUF2865 domain-containing protein [Bradyrhizobium sp.]|nr:MAG: DUF2865 domain-containing protein [Bradyrhizobium sp.]